MVDFPIAVARRRAPARLELKPKAADTVSIAVAIACVVLCTAAKLAGVL